MIVVKRTKEIVEAAEDRAREKALRKIRAERDRLLAACDWTQVADAPVDQAAWRDYRQALRDMPQTTDPLNPSWPKEPT